MQTNQTERRELFMQQARKMPGGTGDQAYERLKRMYLAAIIDADADQYQRDMRELSRICSV